MDEKPTSWLTNALNLWGLPSFNIIGTSTAVMFASAVLSFAGNPLGVYLFALGVLCLVIGLHKAVDERTVKTCVFIPDNVRSFWNHAPQPDGNKLTQFALKGYVTNITTKSLMLAKVKLVSPKAKRQYQEFIFTVKNNAVTANQVLLPDQRVEFDAMFFADGFLGTPKKTMNIKVSICDQYGHWHQVKFENIQGLNSA